MVVFSLMGWSPHLPSEFLVFRRTLCIQLKTFSPTSLSLSSERLSNRLRLTFLRLMIPEGNYFPSFGLLRFRSPLLAESFLLSFPPGTKMFQFPGFPCAGYLFTNTRLLFPGASHLRQSGFPIRKSAGQTLNCS